MSVNLYIAEYVWKYNPRADSERIKKFKNHPVIGKNLGGGMGPSP
jgi:hypothetical protein